MDNINKFFIRFCLQSSHGTFGSDFPYECIMDVTKDEIEAFIGECDLWQQEQAEKIRQEVNIKAIQGKKVMFVGDSITADRFSYRGIVTKAAKLEEYNASISGSVSTNMLLTFKDHIQTFNPDVISIFIGANDSLIIADEKNFVSIEEYEKNIDKMICIGKAAGAQIILSTVLPVDEKRFMHPNRKNNNANIAQYCNVVRKQAQKHKVLLNDFAEFIKNEPLEQIIENDGVHFTPYGHSCLARKWLHTASKIKEENII